MSMLSQGNLNGFLMSHLCLCNQYLVAFDVRQKFDFFCQPSFLHIHRMSVSQDRNKGLGLSNQFPHLEVYPDKQIDQSFSSRTTAGLL